MVIGGWKSDDWYGSPSDEVEVVSLDPEAHPLTECMNNIQPFPYATTSSVGHVLPSMNGGTDC